MRIKQSYNNNVVLVHLDDGNEAVILGTGIGFAKKKGDLVDQEKISKIYYSKKNSKKGFNDSILDEVEPECLEFVETALEEVEKQLQVVASSALFLSLVEHFNNILVSGSYLDDEHPLRWIVKRIYPEIYEVSKKIYEDSQISFNQSIPRSEIVAISLHLINGIQENKMPDTIENTCVINEILRVLEYSGEFTLDKYEIDYSRFITHLEFLFNRLRSENKYLDKEPDGFNQTDYESMFTNFKKHAKITLTFEKVLKIIQKKYGDVGEAEKLFLLIHLFKLSS